MRNISLKFHSCCFIYNFLHVASDPSFPLSLFQTCMLCSPPMMLPNWCSVSAHQRIHKHRAPHVCPECGGTARQATFQTHLEEACLHFARRIGYRFLKLDLYLYVARTEIHNRWKIDFATARKWFESAHTTINFYPGVPVVRLCSAVWILSSPTFRPHIVRCSTSAPIARWPSNLPRAPRVTSLPSIPPSQLHRLSMLTNHWPQVATDLNNVTLLTPWMSSFFKDDLQVCHVWHRVYPEAFALHAFWHSPGKTKGSCVQVSRLHQTLCPERLHDGTHQGKTCHITFCLLCYPFYVLALKNVVSIKAYSNVWLAFTEWLGCHLV